MNRRRGIALFSMALLTSLAPGAYAQTATDPFPLASLSQGPKSPSDAEEQAAKRSLDEKAPRINGLAGAAAPTSQCFTFGANDTTGRTFLKVCITNHGTISYLESPAGRIHLQGNREGYVVCTFNNTFASFEAGIAEGGWTEPSVSQPSGPGTLPLIVTRSMLDHAVELKQTFTLISGDNQLQVVMALKNTSTGVLTEVNLDRYFDGDIGGRTANTYDTTEGAVWGYRARFDGTDNAVMLRQVPSTDVSSVAFFQFFRDWFPEGLRRCGGLFGFGSSGDFVGRVHTFVGNMAPGQTKTVTYRYQRF